MTNSSSESAVSSASASVLTSSSPSPCPSNYSHHAFQVHVQAPIRAFVKVFSILELSDHILSLVRPGKDIKCLRQVSHLLYELCLPFFKLPLSEFLFLSRSPIQFNSVYWQLQHTQHLIRPVVLTRGNLKFMALLLSAPKTTPVFHKYLASTTVSNNASQSSAPEDPSNSCSAGVHAKRFERGALTVLSLKFMIDAVDKQEVFSCLDRFWKLRELDIEFKLSTKLIPSDMLELLTLGLKVNGSESQYQRFNLHHTLESFRMSSVRRTMPWDSFHLFLHTFPRLRSVALSNIEIEGFVSVTPSSLTSSSSSSDSHFQAPNIASFSYQSPISSELSARFVETFPNLKELSVRDLSDIWRYDSSDTALSLTSEGRQPAVIPFRHLERLHSRQVRHPPPRHGSAIDYGSQDSWKWSSFPPGLVDLKMESNDSNSILVVRWMKQLTEQLEQSSVRLRSLRLGKSFMSGEILLSSTVCHELQHLEILMRASSVFDEVWRRNASLVRPPSAVSASSLPSIRLSESSTLASATVSPLSQLNGNLLDMTLTESMLDAMEETGGTKVKVTVDSVRSRIPFVTTLRTLKLKDMPGRIVRKLPLHLLLQCMVNLEEFDLEDPQHAVHVFSKLKEVGDNSQDRQRLLPSLRVLKLQVKSDHSAVLTEVQLMDLFQQLENLQITKTRQETSRDWDD